MSGPDQALPLPQPDGPLNLFRPLLLLFYSACYAVPTFISLAVNLQISTLLNWSAFKDAWFARFWAFLGPRARERSAPHVTALLSHAASGVLLDIGPGSGQWVSLFARANNADITKIYGVEPNLGMHGELRQNAMDAGLGDMYEIIGCGAQELSTKGGIQPGSIDTICTVQCLCSIPEPQANIRELYPLLKPGGKWIMFEHVKTKRRTEFVEYWQRLLNVIWGQFFNGCDLRRPTDEWLREAGEWESVDLGPVSTDGPYDTLPHIKGILTKKI